VKLLTYRQNLPFWFPIACPFVLELSVVCSLLIEVNKIVEMKKSRMIPNELLHSIDIANTLNGGTSQPIVDLQQYEHYREVKCKVPGIADTSLQVEITNNFLSIFYTQEFKSNEVGIQVPRIVYHKPIPYFIDVAAISAIVVDGFLCVTLPFNELANGYHKKISIQE
jgi:HSP20 family molecular chaperone IbpA